MEISKSKIEKRAIGALTNLIDEHNTMDSSFNSMDKEMSWDGYIWLFNGNEKQDKIHYDDKVPVQIKGHIDRQKKYMNKKLITYPVNIADLKVYFKDRGVIYFEIFMSKDGTRKEIFYSALFPSKIKSYLKLIRKKGNKNSINITFSKMKNDPNNLYSIVKQFSNESKKQGFGEGPIVQNTINLDGIEQITSVTASAVGTSSLYEFLQKLGTGDVCLYGKREGERIEFPIEWYNGSIYFVKKTINEEISVNGKIYFNEYQKQLSSEGKIMLFPSENLIINLTSGRVEFILNSKISELRKDAEFLLDIAGNDNFTISGIKIPCKSFETTNDLEKQLKYFIDLDESLKMINYNIDRDYKDLTENAKKELSLLVGIKNGLMNNLFDENHIFNWRFEGKYIPIVASRHKTDEKNDLKNLLYTNKYKIAIKDNNGNHYKIPLFTLLDMNTICNLYLYDYTYFKGQIDEAVVNEYTLHSLNNVVLQLINIYDSTQNIEFLRLAKYQMGKIENLAKYEDYYILNQLQIKYREHGLDRDDEQMLIKIKEDNIIMAFGKYVLLRKKEIAEDYYNQLSLEEIKALKEYPIMCLYEAL